MNCFDSEQDFSSLFAEALSEEQALALEAQQDF